METPKLSYSERKAKAENRVMALVTDSVPQPIINAVAHNIQTRPGDYYLLTAFLSVLATRCATSFGWWNFSGTDGTIKFLSGFSLDYFLDFCEILAEEGARIRSYQMSVMTKIGTAWPSVEADINEMFARHRFGYILENAFIRQLGSPVLDTIIVRPALFASQVEGWEQVEASFSDAVEHRRGGDAELDDALTAAAASVEAALKAAGYKGTKLSDLLKSYTVDERVGGALKSLPADIKKLLENVMSERHSKGDAHGKSPGTPPVDPATADLLIHWAGAFIVYLHDRDTSHGR